MDFTYFSPEKAVMYADLHCDLLSYLSSFAREPRSGSPQNETLPKRARNGKKKKCAGWRKNACDFRRTLRQSEKRAEEGKRKAIADFSYAKCALQCFALFCKGESAEDEGEIFDQLDLFLEIRAALRLGGVHAVLTAEGGGATCGDTEKLGALFHAGVKMFSPVWNNDNSMSAACNHAGALTEKGKNAVAFALESGVIPDISHVSDDGTRQIFSLAKARKKAVVASHSLVRALCPNGRNLTDSQISEIADSGGVVGVCFVSDFAGKYPLEEHIAYLVNKGGEDCVALGGDFFGCENPLVCGARNMPAFFRSLERYFSPRLMEKIAYGNVRQRLPSLFM